MLHLNSCLWTAALQIRKIVMEMEDILLIKQDAFSSYELSEFRAKQELRRQYILDTLHKYQENISNIIIKACHQVVDQNDGPFRPIVNYEEEKQERNLRRLKYCKPQSIRLILPSYPFCSALHSQRLVWYWKINSWSSMYSSQRKTSRPNRKAKTTADYRVG